MRALEKRQKDCAVWGRFPGYGGYDVYVKRFKFGVRDVFV